MAIEAVIFDMDGLLLDTETLGIKACVYAGEQQGLDIDVGVVLSTLGQTEPFSNAIYRQHYPAFEAERFWADFDAWMRKTTDETPPALMPRALETLKGLKDKRIRTGLCSSSPMERIGRYMASTGIGHFFDAVVSGDDGAKSKPAPDMYLLMAKKLGVMPERCMVLEDSTNGLKAAHAAGMLSCMVPDQIPYGPELAPFTDRVLKDLGEALDLLGGN